MVKKVKVLQPFSHAHEGQVFNLKTGDVVDLPVQNDADLKYLVDLGCIEVIEVEKKAEPKVEKKAEPKVEKKAEPKVEKKAEPKAEPKAEKKAEPKKPVKKPYAVMLEGKTDPLAEFLYKKSAEKFIAENTNLGKLSIKSTL
jgi:outer membrane biosynthesis protein TonB